jgi:hypothetical protein
LRKYFTSGTIKEKNDVREIKATKRARERETGEQGVAAAVGSSNKQKSNLKVSGYKKEKKSSDTRKEINQR